MDVLDDLFLGTMELRFLNDFTKVVDVIRVIRDDKGYPMLLMSSTGTVWNWSNIISSTPIKEGNK